MAIETGIHSLPRRSAQAEPRFALLRRLFENRVTVIGLAIVLFWVVIAITGPLIAPFDPNQTSDALTQPPSLQHLMGTDNLGRDVFSRLLLGSRPVLVLAPIAVGLGMLIGVTLGLISGYWGGMVDESLMRVLDAVMAFPTLLLYMVIIAAVGPSRANVVLAITIGGIPGIARITRSLVLDVRDREFVQSARLRGEGRLYIMFSEILPNCAGPLIVDGCLRIGYAAFAIGTLGFLGLGLPPPDPDWGRMVAQGRTWIVTAPWTVIFPSLAISSLVIGLNLFADGLKESSAKR